MTKTTYFLNSSEVKSRKNVPPARRLQRGPPGPAPAGPPHQPGGGERGHSEAATGLGFAETTSALVGSSVLAYDAASTYGIG